MTLAARFQPGDEVVLRYITRMDGQVGMSWPFRVVRDEPDLVALFIPAGATFMRWHTPEGGVRELAEGLWRRDVLRLMFPGEAYSVWVFWEGLERRFTTYYVNFEEPFRRTAIGFDTNDHTLDIMVRPDLSWVWKDREEFEALVQNGTFSKEFGEFVHETAQRVISIIETGTGPFSEGWPEWLPPAGWTTPVLHPRWREEDPVIWERREWAYPLANRVER